MASELIHKFEISYGIPESQLEAARPYIDLIQKGIAGLRPLARDIIGAVGAKDQKEQGVSALYHACKHELGLACDQPHEVYTLDAAKVGKEKIVEPIEPIEPVEPGEIDDIKVIK